jgi:uncharacterized protein with FMN-binding domain
MGKMDKKWVILCSTAVAAVYAAGYYTTETQAANANNQPIHQIAKNVQAQIFAFNDSKISNGQTNDTSASNGQKNNQASNNTSAGNGKSNNKMKNNTASSKSQKTSLYKNGTFTGQGMNRRGTIEVQVTINNDKITDVQISNFGMHYSESDIVGLPDEVLKNQSAQVTNVSGATYSTQAFEDAVQDALNQAQNTAG